MTKLWPFERDAAAEAFQSWLDEQTHPRVIEIGGAMNSRRDWLHADADYVCVDIAEGEGIVVADAHHLEDVFEKGEFDALICTSTLEHLERPWEAAESFAYVLRPGGRAFIHSHQSFPLHGYPSDFFRFSDEAFKVLFGPPSWLAHSVGYNHPCFIVPQVRPVGWGHEAKAWLNVTGCFERL